VLALNCENRRMGSVRFTASLVPRGPAAAVVLDGDQVAAVGEGAKRFPVVATVNGYAWRTTITRMRGEFLLGLNRAVRIDDAKRDETRERRVARALKMLREGRTRS
jgi:Domain of unknown function (DUF1905)